jgi:hypothetical protein
MPAEQPLQHHFLLLLLLLHPACLNSGTAPLGVAPNHPNTGAEHDAAI